MNALRLAALMVALLFAAALPCPGAAAVIHVQYQQTPPVTAPSAGETRAAAPVERERPSGERDTKLKERAVPPPRPIVAPEGQQQNPALRDECAWLGQRIVSLLYRDDAMTSRDFMPFYTQFGCPEEHLSKAFACVVGKNGDAESEALADRVALCWADPTKRPATSASAAPPAAAAGAPEAAQPPAQPAAKPAATPAPAARSAAPPAAPSVATPAPAPRPTTPPSEPPAQPQPPGSTK